MNDGDSISGSKKANITIATLRKSDAGKYSCIVKDGIGSVTISSSVTLDVSSSSSSSSSSSTASNSYKVSEAVTTNANEASIINAINTSTTKTIVINIDNLVQTNKSPLISQGILADLKANLDKTLVIKTSNSSIEIKSKDGKIKFTQNGIAINGFKAVG